MSEEITKKRKEWGEELRPMLREYHWLIRTEKIPEDEFVKEMLHRMELLLSRQKEKME